MATFTGTSGNDTFGGGAQDDSASGLDGNDTLSGGAGGDVLDGGAGDDSLLGGDGYDALTGGTGNDTLDGGGAGNEGAEVSYSGAGSAVQVDLAAGTASSVTEGADTLRNIIMVRGGVFDDHLAATEDRNDLFGNDGNDTLLGRGGIDYLDGGNGADSLDGGDGDDELNGGAGNDTLAGGAGRDRASYLAMQISSSMNVDLAAGTASGSEAGNDLLIGIEDADGNAGNDTLRGDSGANKLLGWDGNDSIEGRDGDDTIDGWSGSDRLDGGAGFDLLDLRIHWNRGAVVNLATGIVTDGIDGTDTVSGIEAVWGVEGRPNQIIGDGAANVLHGSSANDTLAGGGGDDTLMGFGANDRLDGGDGDDRLAPGSNGTHTIDGGAGNDVLVLSGNRATYAVIELAGGAKRLAKLGIDVTTSNVETVQFDDASVPAASVVAAPAVYIGTAGNDTYVGGIGADSASGLAGNDTLHGGDGNDTLSGGPGADQLRGEAGDDSVFGDDGDDTFFGSTGSDTVDGGNGFDTFDYSTLGATITFNVATGLVVKGNGGGTDRINGWNGDFIVGSALNDTLVGSSGSDILSGGLGDDSIDGGAGGDYAAYGNASSGVTVDLQAGSASGGAGNDVLLNIESVGGSNHADVLRGTGGNDFFRAANGADTLDGRGGNDTADYRDDPAAIDINLAAGQGRDGFGTTDTLISIENVNGGAFNDTLTGNTSNNTLTGRAGNDLIDGGAGNDNLNGGDGNDTLIGSGGADTMQGSLGNDVFSPGLYTDRATLSDAGFLDYTSLTGMGVFITLTASPDGTYSTGTVRKGVNGEGGTDTVDNFPLIQGSQQDDSIVGSAGSYFEQFYPRLGNDTVDGGAIQNTRFPANPNRVVYTSAGGPVTVDLRAGSAGGGDGTDVLRNINEVRGSDHADSLYGSDDPLRIEAFDGRNGNDLIDGRGGFDIVRFDFVNTTPVTVRLDLGTQQDNQGGTDTLVNIEGAYGTGNGDRLVGNALGNRFEGRDGNDTIEPGAGSDTVLGGNGTDWLVYANDAAHRIDLTLGVAVNLTSGETDYASDFEHALGSAGDDVITGSSAANELEGGAGNDAITGAGGADSLEGGAGNDTLDGGVVTDRYWLRDRNTVLYDGAGLGNVTVDLSGITGDGSTGQGTAQDGEGGTDVLRNVSFIVTGGGDDRITGSSGLFVEFFAPGTGNDTIDGGADSDPFGRNVNRVEYLGITGAITADLALGSATGGAGSDRLINITDLSGGSGNDSLAGSDRSDVAERFTGAQGNDTIDGRGGTDVARYDAFTPTSGVNVNLAAGTASDGTGGTDTLLSIEGVYGSGLADTITGSSGDDTIMGRGGNDSLAGGAGSDTLIFSASTTGVTVNLASGAVTDGEGGTDTVSGFEAVWGSPFDDTLIGSTASELFQGRAGNDSITGGGGFDEISYDRSYDRGAVVDVALGITSEDGHGGQDSFSGIVNVTGTRLYADSIAGDSSNNRLWGLGGNDTLEGRYGSDTLNPGSGSDSVDGGEGFDTLTLAGNRAAYTLTQPGGGLLRLVNSATQEDVLFRNIDQVAFADGTVATGALVATTITGATPYADVLVRGDGNDTVDGLAGDDELSGGNGNDSLFGGEGDDRFFPGTGADTVDGGTGLDRLELPGVLASYIVSGTIGELRLVNTATNEDITARNIDRFLFNGTARVAGQLLGSGNTATEFGDSLVGSNGNDTIDGLGGDDGLNGGNGDDVLRGGPGQNLLTGGAGSDTASYDGLPEGVDGSLRDRRVIGGGADDFLFSGMENLEGTAFADRLAGDAAANRLTGLAGNDTLSGDAGDDVLLPGAGSDSIDGGAGSDTLAWDGAVAVTATFSGSGSGTASVGGSGTQSFVSIELLRGSDAADQLAGADAADQLQGAAGNDTLSGNAGNDTLAGDAGNDSLEGGDGDDVADYRSAAAAIVANGASVQDGSGGTDTLAGIETIWASSGNDTLTGDDANNNFRPGPGNDSVDGRGGRDRVDYTAATGGVTVNLAAGTASGADQGNDTLVSIERADGSTFADTLIGGTTDDLLRGFDGNDSLSGGAGDDTLGGGPGADTIDGGPGIDWLSFRTSTTAVSINLAAATATGGDVLISIEAMQSGSGDDTLTGDDGANTIHGHEGIDSIRAGGGNDSVDAGPGRDSVRADAGNDTLEGGEILDRINFTDINVLLYNEAPAGVVMDYSAITGDGSQGFGTVQDGFGGTDSVRNMSIVVLSNHDDRATGSSALWFEQWEPLAGDDTIDGGAMNDRFLNRNANRLNYQSAPGPIDADLATGVATGWGRDVFSNINQLRGTAYGDRLAGSDNSATAYSEAFEGRGGDDTIDGRAGFDFARFDESPVGVVANLATGIALDGYGNTDTLLNIEGLRGSPNADRLTGGNEANGSTAMGLRGSDGLERFQGMAGADTIDGGQGVDRAEYTNSPAGIVVQLSATGAGTAADGWGDIDTLVEIEGVLGSRFADRIGGTGALYEWFNGLEGNDTIDGGPENPAALTDPSSPLAIDVISYANDWEQGAVVDLAAGTATDGFGDSDVLANIDMVIGTLFADSIRGGNRADNRRDNTVRGLEGDDTIDGGGGMDTAEFVGPRAGYVVTRLNATTYTVRDSDSANGNEGTDTVSNTERFVFGDEFIAYGQRAEEMVRVAFVLWSKDIIAFPALFSIGFSFYDVGYSFDQLNFAAAVFWDGLSNQELADRLVAYSGTSTRTANDYLGIIAAGANRLEGRAAAIKDAALDPATSALVAASGMREAGVNGLNYVPNYGLLFDLMPG